MPLLRFSQVDVFGAVPFGGNPVAVVHDAGDLTDEQMAAIARWTNLSETTFLLPPTHDEADYRLRIFTPTGELPFAGHPTLGTAHAWLEAGGSAKGAEAIVQECQAGLVRVRRRGDVLAFAAPDLVRTGLVSDATLDRITAALRIGRDEVLSSQWVDNGPGWMVLELASAEHVLALTPDFTALVGFAVGVFGNYEGDGGPVYEIRAFVPGGGVDEDPVTGSLNAGVAQWLRAERRVPKRYTASQGLAVGRTGKIMIDDDGSDVWVGGRTITRVGGDITLA